ncbi:hypothetical protein N7519_001380 [Penicillium mononematosum]|uniref:uncharacterized protein n=1 Tax=Penicillium mononematosum TaxID=268346 RepID=UPI0025492FDD|nr:uncharacterized protein N7519_001380 [Penicillium mononematosum]KAJ6191359.1 hypothetical protein N7519_001380 [Penicillium mononematosum]
MSTYQRNRDTFASNVCTTEKKISIEQWIEDTTKRIEGPTIALGLAMPEKHLGSLEQQPGTEGLSERVDMLVKRITNLKEVVHRQEEKLKKSEVQEKILEEKIASLQEQLSMQDSCQYNSFKDRLAMHERLLKVADQQISTQQELIKHLLEAQVSTSQQLALVTRKLSQQAERGAQQPQVREPKGQHSNTDGVNKSTDASDYVLVSEGETIS